MDLAQKNKTKIFACNMRRNIIEEVFSAQSGHPGGSLSCADILAVLYNVEMRIDPKKAHDPDRDRFVLSKGHCAPALYAALAQKGYFPEEDLKTFRSADSYLQGHPSMTYVPGVDMSTGSLGQGIAAAVGMAMMGKLDSKEYRVFSILGDGELEEGEVWEAAMAAAHYNLDNLTAFVDHNGLQIDGEITKVMNPENISDKFSAFGWNVIDINGHDLDAIYDAIQQAKQVKGRPTMIVCKTHKGQGVSYMVDQAGWHGSAPKQDQRDLAVCELDADLVQLKEV